MKGNDKATTVVNYMYIFLAINYNLIVNFITHIDSAGYVMIFMSIIVLFFNSKNINIVQLKKPVVFWLVWCVFAIFNYMVHPKPYPYSFIILLRMVFVPLISMVIVVKEYGRNPVAILRLCFITFLIYDLGGYYFDSGVLNRDILGDEENVLRNGYAVTACFTLFYMALLNRIGKLSIIWFVILSIIVVLILAMSGTRKAFGAGGLFLVFWAFSLLDIRKTKTWIFVGLFVYLGWIGYDYLMDNTFMGARMEFLESQQEEALPIGAPKFLMVFGDRATHYYYGVIQFFEHPLFGEGLGQSRVNHKGVYFHSEPMAQLTDNGIIGFSLFFALYYWVTKKLLRKRRMNAQIGRCMIGGLVGMFFLMLTAWAWEFPSYFICLGILIGYCKYDNNINTSE